MAQALTESHEPRHSDAHERAGAAIVGPELGGQRDKQDANGRDQHVQYQVEPALNAVQKVDGPLGVVESGGEGVPELARPPKGADGGETLDSLGQHRVQGGLVLEVQEPELARGREVESLQVPNHGHEHWQDGSEVARPRGYEGELHNTDKHR